MAPDTALRITRIVPMKDRFVVFSIARSGGTTLMHLLNCHPDIRCINEPFNPGNVDGRYYERVKDLGSLDEALEEIWRDYNGIKHAWDPTGWPFSWKPYFNEHLLLKPDQKVLLLNRRNILKRIVSSRISEQAQIWTLGDKSDKARLLEFQFEPINTAYVNLKWHLEYEREIIAQQKQLLVERRADFTELWYEDLYETSRTVEEKLDRLNEMLAFLGRERITDQGTLSRVAWLFDPANTKLNSIDTYRRIPGIDVVERQFGSDETGWLFK